MAADIRHKKKEEIIKNSSVKRNALTIDINSQARSGTKRDSNTNVMRHWFQMKFKEDLSDIKKKFQAYYKHYVHHFVARFFDRHRLAGKRVLDFGCGPGFYSAIFAGRGATVVGIDHNNFLIEKAKAHSLKLGLKKVQFICGDLLLSSTKWIPASFDYVIAIDTIVSFDHSRTRHCHERVVSTFLCIERCLKPNGRFYIIERHPCFGQALYEIVSKTGDKFCVRPQGYQIKYKPKNFPHHWFTLDEMTKATFEAGMAVLRIYEPDPGPALKEDNPAEYSFRKKYPGLIVYEIGKIGGA